MLFGRWGVRAVDSGTAVANRILELCRERGISINRLGTVSGVPQSTINNVTSGRNRSVTVSTVKKLCDGLEITLGEFFSTPEFDALDQELK